MDLKCLSVYVLMFILFSTDAILRKRFGKIRKRKNFLNSQNLTVVGAEDDLGMYFTRRTTPCPRLRVTLDPGIEAYYNKKHKKEDIIKRAYFEKAKKEKKKKNIEKNLDSSLGTAPALD